MPHFISDFFGTWHAWWYATEPIATHVLWGLPVFIWARIGKLLEFAGALFMVIDWIGRQRLAQGAKEADVLLSVFGSMPQIASVRDTLKVGMWMLGSENRVRTVNVTLIVIGFLLDFMGS
jgi:hypothetical protein